MLFRDAQPHRTTYQLAATAIDQQMLADKSIHEISRGSDASIVSAQSCSPSEYKDLGALRPSYNLQLEAWKLIDTFRPFQAGLICCQFSVQQISVSIGIKLQNTLLRTWSHCLHDAT